MSLGSLAAAAGSNHAIRMPADLFSLELRFTGLNLSESEKTRFRHKLDGFDSDWVDNGSDRVVRYGRLPPGMYTFRVQAGSASGTWYPNDAYFNFFIPTPWWRSPWAIGWYCVAGAMFVAGIARLVSTRFLRRRLATLAAQQSMQRERIRIAQDMHDEIGSKLTKISFMSERAITELQGQEPVARKLDSIATTSRDLLQSLDEIVWAVNPHNDTLENLAAYLGHYATEYLQNTAVECELHIPRGLPDEPVSAETRHNLFLAFEEALNNALKHGKASDISVSMQVIPGRFEIEIKDNGCGFAFNPVAFEIVVAAEAMLRRRGNGLVNMHQRLLDVGGHCDIQSQPGKGTQVRLTVPVGHLRKI
jgi:signal transduction histidine kinase